MLSQNWYDSRQSQSGEPAPRCRVVSVACSGQAVNDKLSRILEFMGRNPELISAVLRRATK